MSVRAQLLVMSLLAMLAGCANVQAVHFQGTAILPVSSAPDFTLTDQQGAPWTLSHQHGTVTAIFFGYSHCADTCPLALGKLASAIAGLGSAGKGAQIAFITTDPQRDTSAVLGHYIRRFAGAHIIGLTGSVREITAIESSYHVWSQKIPGKRGKNTYDDAHSDVIFLIGRNGNERVLHNPNDSTASLAADLKTLLQ